MQQRFMVNAAVYFDSFDVQSVKNAISTLYNNYEEYLIKVKKRKQRSMVNA